MKNQHGIEGVQLEVRRQKLDGALELLQQTKQFIEEHGSQARKSVTGRLDVLEKTLRSRELKIVVIGEFSRGKSSLVNALLGIELLPMAQEATTAINTFIRQREPDKTQNYVRICYLDPAQAPEELIWTDDSVLKKWGTELDSEHRDMRQSVERIEAMMDHPLLKNDLVLVDTPGLESVVKHHEAITLKAIDEAHVALWIQSAMQLGGNNREWEFLNKTIKHNFDKFITVINMWDLVLDPQDRGDREISEAERIARKLNIVRDAFRKHAQALSEEEKALLTDENHLIGVSARWALSGDPAQIKRSNIQRLGKRIEALCTSTEGLDQILFKPLKALAELQNEVYHDLKNELALLEEGHNIQDLTQLIRENELQIGFLKQERTIELNNSKIEHDYFARKNVQIIQKDLVQPLKGLQAEVEVYLTTDYIKNMIERGEKHITLPEDVQQQYEKVMRQINRIWLELQDNIKNELKDLRISFVNKMSEKARKMEIKLGDQSFDLPHLEANFELDFSELGRFYAQRQQAEIDSEALEIKIARLEVERRNNERESLTYQQELKWAQQELTQLNDGLINSTPPSPVYRERTYKSKEGGVYSSDEYSTRTEVDYGPVDEWKRKQARLAEMAKNQAQEIAQIREKAERISGKSLSQEAAQKEYEMQLRKMKREAEKQGKLFEDKKAELVTQAYHYLRKQTVQQIESYIRVLEKNLANAVEQVCKDQLAEIEKLVDERYQEPLEAHQMQLEEIKKRYEEGTTAIAARRDLIEKTLLPHIQSLQKSVEYLVSDKML